MNNLSSLVNHGLRGTFYFLKRICSTAFFICLGFLLGVMVVAMNPFKNKDEMLEFVIAFVVVLFSSFILWLIFRVLHNRWINKQMTSLKIEFIKGLKDEGIITEDVLDRALTKIT